MLTCKAIQTAIQCNPVLSWRNSAQMIIDELLEPQWPHENLIWIRSNEWLLRPQPSRADHSKKVRGPRFRQLAKLLLDLMASVTQSDVLNAHLPENFKNLILGNKHDDCRRIILSFALAGDLDLFNALLERFLTRDSETRLIVETILSERGFRRGLVQRAVLSGNIPFIGMIIGLHGPSENAVSSSIMHAQKSNPFYFAAASGSVNVFMYLKSDTNLNPFATSTVFESCIAIACFHNHVDLLTCLVIEVSKYMNGQTTGALTPCKSCTSSSSVSLSMATAVPNNCHDGCCSVHYYKIDTLTWRHSLVMAARQGNVSVLKWFRGAFSSCNSASLLLARPCARERFIEFVVANQDDFVTVDDMCTFASDPKQRFNGVICELLLHRWFGDQGLVRMMYAENCALLNAAIVNGNVAVVRLLHVLGMSKSDIHPASVPNTLEMFVELRENWKVSRADIDIDSTSIYCILSCETNVIVELRKHWGASEAYGALKDVGFNSEHRAYWISSVVKQKHTLLSTLVELRDHWGFTAEHIRSCRNHALMTAVSVDNVDVIRHMKSTWGLRAADALECDAIEVAVSHGSIHVLEGLCDIFGLGAADVRRNRNYALTCVFTAYRHESSKIIKMLRIFRERYGLDSPSDLHMHMHKECPLLSLAAKRADVSVMVELLRGWKLTADDARVNSNEIFQNLVSGRHICTKIPASVDDNVKMLKVLRYGFGLTIEDARSNNNVAIHRACHGKVLEELRRGWGMTADDIRSSFNNNIYNNLDINASCNSSDGDKLGARDMTTMTRNILTRNCVDSDNDLSVYSELRMGYKMDAFDLARVNFAPLQTAAFYSLPEFLHEFSQWPRLSEAIEVLLPEHRLVLRCFPGSESLVSKCFHNVSNIVVQGCLVTNINANNNFMDLDFHEDDQY